MHSARCHSLGIMCMTCCVCMFDLQDMKDHTLYVINGLAILFRCDPIATWAFLVYEIHIPASTFFVNTCWKATEVPSTEYHSIWAPRSELMLQIPIPESDLNQQTDRELITCICDVYCTCSWIFARMAIFPPFFYILLKHRAEIFLMSRLSVVLCEYCLRLELTAVCFTLVHGFGGTHEHGNSMVSSSFARI